MRDIIVENYWDKDHCHYSSIQELVDYYIQSNKEASIVYAFMEVIQFNTYYRNYLQDNGFPALIEKMKSETQYLEQNPKVMQKLEDWWKDIQGEGGIGEYDIQCYHHTDAFSLFGEQVNGIDGLHQIIQVSGEAGPFSKEPILSETIESGRIFSDRRNNMLSQLYAALLWKSYPRFDISDYSDNRKYRCYYISNQPFNDSIFKNSRDGGMEHLNEKIPLSRLPLVYDKGDSSVMYVLTPRKCEQTDVIDIAIKNLKKKIDEIPEYGPFDKVCEFFDNTDTLSGQYVDKFALEIYNMPESIQPDQRKRYIDLSAFGKDIPYKASALIFAGNNSEIKDYLSSPVGRTEIENSMIEQAESIRTI